MVGHDAHRIGDALEAVQALGGGTAMTARIARIEQRLRHMDRDAAAVSIRQDDVITDDVLRAALLIKSLAGQINVVVHAVGMLVSLQYLLERGEVIEDLSLGAGNTGRAHDLETDRRVAEFKFIDWRGGRSPFDRTAYSSIFSIL